MASPVTARSGIRWAGLGMVIATVATFLLPGLHNLALIVLALVIGTALAWVSGKKVAITDMPQMVALYNGMGGGSAAAIGAVELLRFSGDGRARLRRMHAGAGGGRRADRRGLAVRLGDRLGQARRPHGQALHLPGPAAVQRARVALAAVVLGGIVDRIRSACRRSSPSSSRRWRWAC